MGLFEKWKETADKKRSQAENDSFWTDYLEREKRIYEKLLENHETVYEGTVSELAEKFEMETTLFAGFLDGINTSLVNKIELDTIEEQTNIKLEIDFEKLFYNMLDARAEWLYTLEQWDDVLPIEKRVLIKKEFNRANIAVSNKIGRNDPCPCGSGKKYKKCCGAN